MKMKKKLVLISMVFMLLLSVSIASFAAEGNLTATLTATADKQNLKAGEEVLISFNKNKMNIKTENLEILLKLVEGEFPDYDKVIPYNNSKEIKVAVNSLKDVLGKISIVSNDKTKNVKISIASENINLEISSSDGSMAKGDIKTDYTGEEIITTLNAKYLLDILGQMETEKFIFKIQDGSLPLLIKQEKGDDLLFVLMPIRS